MHGDSALLKRLLDPRNVVHQRALRSAVQRRVDPHSAVVRGDVAPGRSIVQLERSPLIIFYDGCDLLLLIGRVAAKIWLFPFILSELFILGYDEAETKR